MERIQVCKGMVRHKRKRNKKLEWESSTIWQVFRGGHFAMVRMTTI